MVPSGFVFPDARLCIGAGVLVDPRVLIAELDQVHARDRCFVDFRCGVIDEDHIARDKKSDHLRDTIGSTGTGCGPANADRVMRIGRLARDVPELAPFLLDVPAAVNAEIDSGAAVLIEGTQGFGISLYYGTYPFVTSKDTSASQMASDVGVGPTSIDDVVVVFKAYPTRVGEGPFSTEMDHAQSNALGIQEFGTVTHRERRIGCWDGEMARVLGHDQRLHAGGDHRDRQGRPRLFRRDRVEPALDEGPRVHPLRRGRHRAARDPHLDRAGALANHRPASRVRGLTGRP